MTTTTHITDQATSSRPLVTFALFAYGQQQYVAEAIAAALAQTYQPLEIILSDDCSPDGTFDIMRQQTQRYAGPHQIVLNQNPENLGATRHVNHVFSRARGDLVVMAAGDDVSSIDRVAKLVTHWQAAGRPGVVGSDVEFIAQDGSASARTVKRSPPLDTNADSVTQLTDFVLRGQGMIYGCTEAWSRSAFEFFGELPADLHAEDRLGCFRSLLLGSLAVHQEKLVRYRLHDANASVSIDLKSEAELARKYRGDVALWRQCLRDLHTARQASVIDEDDAVAIEALLQNRLQLANTRAQWWQLNSASRVRELYRSLLHDGYSSEVRWMIKRLPPAAVFQTAQHLRRAFCSRSKAPRA